MTSAEELQYSTLLTNLSSLVQNTSEIKTNKCHRCNQLFMTPSQLKEHSCIDSKAGRKCYICPECGKSFNCRSGVIVHIRTHTGEKPFKCPQCGRAFNHSSHVTRHMRTHTKSKPHKCPICAMEFSWKESLKKHMVIHTGDKTQDSPNLSDDSSQPYLVISSATSIKMEEYSSLNTNSSYSADHDFQTYQNIQNNSLQKNTNTEANINFQKNTWKPPEYESYNTGLETYSETSFSPTRSEDSGFKFSPHLLDVMCCLQEEDLEQVQQYQPCNFTFQTTSDTPSFQNVNIQLDNYSCPYYLFQGAQFDNVHKGTMTDNLELKEIATQTEHH